jgi:methylated-DNA-protein-cysteine methyltransferase related protein
MTIKQRLIEEVNKIPYGKVVSYGYIGNIIGSSGWGVGVILSGMSPQECESVKWYRVVNKQGYISSLKLGFKGTMQIDLLKAEGVLIANDTVDAKYIIG